MCVHVWDIDFCGVFDCGAYTYASNPSGCSDWLVLFWQQVSLLSSLYVGQCRYSDAMDHAMAAYCLNRNLVALNAKAGVDMAAVRQLLAYVAKVRGERGWYQWYSLNNHAC